MEDLITIRKVVKGEKTFYNIYLFGVQIQNSYKNEYQKLYYQAREYCRANGIEVVEIVKNGYESSETKSKAKK